MRRIKMLCSWAAFGLILSACSSSSSSADGTGGAVGTGGDVGRGGEPGTGGTGATSGDVGKGGAPGTGGVMGGASGSGTTFSQAPNAAAERDALDTELAKSAGTNADALIGQFGPETLPEPGYQVADIRGLDRIQASSVALSAADLATLAQRGFVISAKQSYPTFTYGLKTAYLEHLPVYVSADSILFAIHRSYDEILKAVELALLKPDLSTLISGLRARLAAGGAADFGADVQADLDVYLAVAQSLLDGKLASPVASGDARQIQTLYDGGTTGTGTAELVLFGDKRIFDFSQLTPRGHYTDSTELSRYFRASMWFGRTDLRLIETREDGSQVFLRRQFNDVVALAGLLEASLAPAYQRIDATVTAFVGGHDYMTVDQVKPLLDKLGSSSAAGLGELSDATIAQAIIDSGYGAQRIASQIMMNGVGVGTLPLARSFALLGQRYVVDSEVFSNVVYDRVQGGRSKRMMPNPLDVAFSVFDNGQAASLLKPELDKYSYAPDLSKMHTLVENHGASFWNENLYNAWLGGLRALSPARASAPEAASAVAGLAPTMRTEAWGRRLLNAQLASWAELRHDTLLYAKQSYTGGISCEFPDAYVDPYPEFFARVSDYAALGLQLADTIGSDALPPLVRVREHFQKLKDTATQLYGMAARERTGQPFTEEMLAFINKAVVVQETCGEAFATGWYPDLFFGDPTEFDPTIADVHTQPTDEFGADVGRVLHVGTGYARSMVVVVENCMGPRAYVGPVSSYYEKITEDYERLSDPEWQDAFSPKLEDVSWMRDLVSR